MRSADWKRGTGLRLLGPKLLCRRRTNASAPSTRRYPRILRKLLISSSLIHPRMELNSLPALAKTLTTSQTRKAAVAAGCGPRGGRRASCPDSRSRPAIRSVLRGGGSPSRSTARDPRTGRKILLYGCRNFRLRKGLALLLLGESRPHRWPCRRHARPTAKCARPCSGESRGHLARKARGARRRDTT